MKFKNKTAVIVGGASGIGEATVELFSKEGAEIMIGDINYKEAKKVANRMSKSNNKKNKIKPYEVDVSCKDNVDSFISQVIKDFNKIDILVNCAGVTDIENIDFTKLNEEAWDNVVNVNLKGTFLICQRVMVEMIKQKYGRIITLGSLAGTIGGLVVGANYSASKSGVIGLTKSMAKYAAAYNITINCVSPAMIDTNMTKDWDQELKNQQTESIPLKRFGTAKEVASTIVYLASEDASFITGATININGGLFMG